MLEKLSQQIRGWSRGKILNPLLAGFHQNFAQDTTLGEKKIVRATVPSCPRLLYAIWYILFIRNVNAIFDDDMPGIFADQIN